MNSFAGIGRIKDIDVKAKVVKFNLVSEQGRPCTIPCVIINPSDDERLHLRGLLASEKIVWLRGYVSSHEYEYNGKTIRTMDVVSTASQIKAI